MSDAHQGAPSSLGSGGGGVGNGQDRVALEIVKAEAKAFAMMVADSRVAYTAERIGEGNLYGTRPSHHVG